MYVVLLVRFWRFVQLVLNKLTQGQLDRPVGDQSGSNPRLSKEIVNNCTEMSSCWYLLCICSVAHCYYSCFL